MTKKKRYKRYSPEFKREALKRAMLTQIYIEALLVDEGLADQVWIAANIVVKRIRTQETAK